MSLLERLYEENADGVSQFFFVFNMFFIGIEL